MYIGHKLVHRFPLRGTARDSRDFGPVATFLRLVYYNFDFHDRLSSDPHRHDDVAVLEAVVAAVVGAHLPGGLGVLEFQAHVAAV
jgi:hypothetical protein